MAAEACKKGLRLHNSITDQWKARVDPHGPMHDSRAGIGAYYRYNPRSVTRLVNEVNIPASEIHHTVFDRVAPGRP